MDELAIKAMRRLAGLGLLMIALIFIPAGTLAYWQAWLFLAVYFGTSFAITLYLLKFDAALLERRMRGGPSAEKTRIQKIIMSFASAGFIGLLVVPGLDHRFGWSHMPSAWALAGDAIVLCGWAIVFLVFKQNSFGSATIEVMPDQKVIDTGIYGVIRHPMYTGGLVLLAGVPIALGSWWGALVMIAVVLPVVWRLFEEEAFLAQHLPGYATYREKVRYRLIPLIW